MTGACVVLVQLVLHTCDAPSNASQQIQHKRIEFVSIVCANKAVLVISLLMALFVVGTISAAVIQIVGASLDLKKETDDIYEIVLNPPTNQDNVFDMLREQGDAESVVKSCASSPVEPSLLPAPQATSSAEAPAAPRRVLALPVITPRPRQSPHAVVAAPRLVEDHKPDRSTAQSQL